MGSTWSCGDCSTANDAGAASCAVCGTARGPAVADPAPRVPVVAGRQGANAGVAGQQTTVVAAAAQAPRPRRRTATVAAIATVVVVLVAGAWAAGRSGGGDPAATADPDRVAADERDGAETTASSAAPEVAPEAPATTLAAAPTLPSSAPPTTTTRRSSSGSPTTSPATAAPSSTSSSASFVDDAHLVRLTVPSSFTATAPFDGTSATWEGRGVTFTYEVVTFQSVSDALARRDAVASGLSSIKYLPDPDDARFDGRYVVAGSYADGGAMYERGRIRCGDLVRYRFDWVGDPAYDVVEDAAEALVSSDESLDSMGGIHVDC